MWRRNKYIHERENPLIYITLKLVLLLVVNTHMSTPWRRQVRTGWMQFKMKKSSMHSLPPNKYHLPETTHTDSHRVRVAETDGPSSCVGGVKPLWEDLIPVCLEFLLHLFSAMLWQRLFCFQVMPAVWRVMLLWVCFCICLPAQAQGALVVSRRDALTQVFKISNR